MKTFSVSRSVGLTLALFLFLAAFGGVVVLAQDETSSHMENVEAWVGVDIWHMIKTADMMGKLSLVVLGCFSLASWAVMIYKELQIGRAVRQTDQFIKACNSSSGQLDEAFKVSADYPESPLAQILREVYLELELENWFKEGYGLDPAGRIEMARFSLDRVFERTMTNELLHLESKLIFLATTVSVAPFIGLFGTVWGIMVAFQGFGTKGSVSITALAPGLATALLVTVGGLFCAIPATLVYNHFANRIKHLTGRMDSFALELSGMIIKQIVKS